MARGGHLGERDARRQQLVGVATRHRRQGRPGVAECGQRARLGGSGQPARAATRRRTRRLLDLAAARHRLGAPRHALAAGRRSAATRVAAGGAEADAVAHECRRRRVLAAASGGAGAGGGTRRHRGVDAPGDGCPGLDADVRGPQGRPARRVGTSSAACVQMRGVADRVERVAEPRRDGGRGRQTRRGGGAGCLAHRCSGHLDPLGRRAAARGDRAVAAAGSRRAGTARRAARCRARPCADGILAGRGSAGVGRSFATCVAAVGRHQPRVTAGRLPVGVHDGARCGRAARRSADARARRVRRARAGSVHLLAPGLPAGRDRARPRRRGRCACGRDADERSLGRRVGAAVRSDCGSGAGRVRLGDGCERRARRRSSGARHSGRVRPRAGGGRPAGADRVDAGRQRS